MYFLCTTEASTTVVSWQMTQLWCIILQLCSMCAISLLEHVLRQTTHINVYPPHKRGGYMHCRSFFARTTLWGWQCHWEATPTMCTWHWELRTALCGDTKIEWPAIHVCVPRGAWSRLLDATCSISPRNLLASKLNDMPHQRTAHLLITPSQRHVDSQFT